MKDMCNCKIAKTMLENVFYVMISSICKGQLQGLEYSIYKVH